MVNPSTQTRCANHSTIRLKSYLYQMNIKYTLMQRHLRTGLSGLKADIPFHRSPNAVNFVCIVPLIKSHYSRSSALCVVVFHKNKPIRGRKALLANTFVTSNPFGASFPKGIHLMISGSNWVMISMVSDTFDASIQPPYHLGCPGNQCLDGRWHDHQRERFE